MPARTWARYQVYPNAQFLSRPVWWWCGGVIRPCYIMIPTGENKYSNPTNNCPWSFPLPAWPWSREHENSCQLVSQNVTIIDVTSSLQCNDQALTRRRSDIDPVEDVICLMSVISLYSHWIVINMGKYYHSHWIVMNMGKYYRNHF